MTQSTCAVSDKYPGARGGSEETGGAQGSPMILPAISQAWSGLCFTKKTQQPKRLSITGQALYWGPWIPYMVALRTSVSVAPEDKEGDKERGRQTEGGGDRIRLQPDASCPECGLGLHLHD